MSSLNGQKLSYVQLHGVIFVPDLGNLPAKLIAGKIAAEKGTGYDLTKIDDVILCKAPNGTQFFVPLTQCMVAALEKTPILNVVK